MHQESYSKTFALLAFALFVGLGATTMLGDSVTPTGLVVDENVDSSLMSWPEFFLGLFLGLIVVGLIAGLWYHEHSRL